MQPISENLHQLIFKNQTRFTVIFFGFIIYQISDLSLITFSNSRLHWNFYITRHYFHFNLITMGKLRVEIIVDRFKPYELPKNPEVRLWFLNNSYYYFFFFSLFFPVIDLETLTFWDCEFQRFLLDCTSGGTTATDFWTNYRWGVNLNLK